MKVYGYIRVSGRGQTEGDGPERQKQAIEKFCQAQGLSIDEFFFEQITGTSDAMERPKFSAMLESFDAPVLDGLGRVDDTCPKVLVVERMDRLARDLMVSEMLLRECRQRGIEVFSSDQGDCTNMASDGGDPTRVLIRQIMGALAQWEKSNLVKKLYAARKRKKEKTGRCEGYRPLNECAGGQEVINLIHNLYRPGERTALRIKEIARLLNEDGWKTRRGKQWTEFSVLYVIKNHKPTNQ
jgi:DNA invertase Pin-like site-specific DNA recombinase